MELQELLGRQKAAGYVGILQRPSLITEGPRICGDEWFIHQDNAAVHTARQTMAFFRHPACSPDLNPIENLWGWMARYDYRKGKQFVKVNELRDAIIRSWSSIPPTLYNF